jgi:uncharacterized protein (DUF427 family)
MALTWQQGPFGEHPAGRFLLEDALPEHILYAEPAGRRMRVELAGTIIAQSDDVTLLHETGRYPVAYFPVVDVDQTALRSSPTRGNHRELGDTHWWSLHIGDRLFDDVAWSHPQPPAHAASLARHLAFVWDAMDAFYEEDEPILGHAADPYHRVDIRASSRRITVDVDGILVADTNAALAVFETGFAPRWYLPRRDVVPGALSEDAHRTLCPYKGVARYFDVVVGHRRLPAAAWSYPDAFPESARLRGYVSFDHQQVAVHVDGERLPTTPYQEVLPTGSDRNLAAT